MGTRPRHGGHDGRSRVGPGLWIRLHAAAGGSRRRRRSLPGSCSGDSRVSVQSPIRADSRHGDIRLARCARERRFPEGLRDRPAGVRRGRQHGGHVRRGCRCRLVRRGRCRGVHAGLDIAVSRRRIPRSGAHTLPDSSGLPPGLLVRHHGYPRRFLARAGAGAGGYRQPVGSPVRPVDGQPSGTLRRARYVCGRSGATYPGPADGAHLEGGLDRGRDSDAAVARWTAGRLLPHVDHAEHRAGPAPRPGGELAAPIASISRRAPHGRFHLSRSGRRRRGHRRSVRPVGDIEERRPVLVPVGVGGAPFRPGWA